MPAKRPRFIPSQKFYLRFKVAQSDFSVTVPFYFEKLLFHHKLSNSKLILTVVLEKDESFWWGMF